MDGPESHHVMEFHQPTPRGVILNGARLGPRDRSAIMGSAARAAGGKPKDLRLLFPHFGGATTEGGVGFNPRIIHSPIFEIEKYAAKPRSLRDVILSGGRRGDRSRRTCFSDRPSTQFLRRRAHGKLPTSRLPSTDSELHILSVSQLCWSCDRFGLGTSDRNTFRPGEEVEVVILGVWI